MDTLVVMMQMPQLQANPRLQTKWHICLELVVRRQGCECMQPKHLLTLLLAYGAQGLHVGTDSLPNTRPQLIVNFN